MFRPILLLTFLLLLSSTTMVAQNFAEEQLRFPRVRKAKAAAEEKLKQHFKDAEVAWPPTSIYFRAFKEEGQFEVWSKGKSGKYVRVLTYEVCAKSGKLGPKRKEGDLQVPEGFYRISAFNPSSSFHLSLRVNYPNASDKIVSDQENPGGDIYVHGNCVTIGCLPMTDVGIEEIYWLSVVAKSAGQKTIPISIFPMRLSQAKLEKASRNHPADLIEFWKQLQPGYLLFEQNKQLPSISFQADGSMHIFQ